MRVHTDFASIRTCTGPAHQKGKRIALVPTMGAIHVGHLKLVEFAQQRADIVIASIFVNPMQFAPHEDLDTYPRPIGQDKKLLDESGVDHLLIPDLGTIYPRGVDVHTVVSVPRLSNILCGASRVKHFDGVCTVVLKLLLGVRPHLLVLGAKDYQQFFIVRRMVEDLGVDTEVLAAATVREADGLAYSSRNGYLSTEERAQAPALRNSLLNGKKQWESGERDVDKLTRSAHAYLGDKVSSVEYWTICDLDTLDPLRGMATQQESVIICACVSIGNTRLIDNIICGSMGVL